MPLNKFLVRGLGFFNDAYDLFIMNVVNVILEEEFGKQVYTSELKSVVSAAALFGAVLGQIVFGFLADRLGRRLNMVITCTILIFGGLLCMFAKGTTPTGTIYTLVFARAILGFGIGGEYPLAATSTAEDASSVTDRNKRVALTFSLQGVGSLVAAITGNSLVATYASGKRGENNVDDLDFIWRCLFGIGVIPATIVIYFRWIAEETESFRKIQSNNQQQQSLQSRGKIGVNTAKSTAITSRNDKGYKLTVNTIDHTSANNRHETEMEYHEDDDEEIDIQIGQTNSNTSEQTPLSIQSSSHYSPITAPSSSPTNSNVDDSLVTTSQQPSIDTVMTTATTATNIAPSIQFVMHYYGKYLVGTAGTWFLFDIVFYAQNLFSASMLSVVGITSPTLRQITTQNVLVSMVALPGYYVAVCFINRLGRRYMQIQGFCFMAILFLILAGVWHDVKNDTNSFVLLYGLALFFSNFGPNTSTFVLPTEMFPTRIRATCHGISAAMGKLGAAIGSFGFSFWVNIPSFGYAGVFITFAVICILAIPLTWFYTFDNSQSMEEMDTIFQEQLLAFEQMKGTNGHLQHDKHVQLINEENSNGLEDGLQSTSSTAGLVQST